MQCACHGTALSQALPVTQRVMYAGRDSAQGGMPKLNMDGLADVTYGCDGRLRPIEVPHPRRQHNRDLTPAPV